MSVETKYKQLQKRLTLLTTSRDKKKGVLEMKRKAMLESLETSDMKKAAKAVAAVTKKAGVTAKEFEALCKELYEMAHDKH